MSGLILGVDAGNFMAKVAGPHGLDSYRTPICDWFERDVEETHGKDDMEFCIGGRKGFSGSIAALEDEFGGGSMFGDSKAHEDTKIRVLLAIHRYLEKYCEGVESVSLVTGQPIATHKESEKRKIIDMLEGPHTFTVNGFTRKVYIDKVAVGGEGSGAFWAASGTDNARIIDLGSGTVNCATIVGGKFINNASGTFNFGMETVNNKEDLQSISRGVVRGTTKLKWKKSDKVHVCGGSAKALIPFISEHYQDAILIQPTFQSTRGITIADPVFANAIGFYNLARKAFQ